MGEAVVETLDLPARGRRILVIVNPVSGRRSSARAGRVVDALRARGCQIELRETRAPGDAEVWAREAALAGGYDIIAAAGGDGPLNEVVNGIGEAPVALAIIPVGTANVMALELGLPFAPEAVAEVLAEGRPRALWPGLANGRRFLAMASAGFDGHILHGVTPALKARTGKAAYVLSGLACWARCQVGDLRVYIDGQTRHASWAVITNTRRYAGRFVLAPEADVFAPGFQAVLFPGAGRADLMRYALALVAGRASGLADVETHAVRTIEITGGDREPYEIDGDAGGHLPLTVGVAPRPLFIVVPDRV